MHIKDFILNMHAKSDGIKSEINRKHNQCIFTEYNVKKASLLNLRKDKIPLIKNILAVHWNSY